MTYSEKRTAIIKAGSIPRATQKAWITSLSEESFQKLLLMTKNNNKI